MIDRVGKGIRGAPRDALVADVTPPEIRGAAYGLRRALDTVGAFLGPLLAVLLMFIWANDFHAIFLGGGHSRRALHSPARIRPTGAKIRHRAQTQQSAEARKPEKALRRLLVGGRDRQHFHPRPLQRSLSGAARPADGDPALYHPALVMVAMNLVYSLTAYPFGKLSDSMSHSKLLQWGAAGADPRRYRAGAQRPLEHAADRRRAVGIHMGMTQGLLAAMVAHTAPPELRGTAFGMFNLMSGLALLLASTGAGVLWETFGAASTFYAGAIICVVTFIGMRVMPSAYRQD